MIKPNTKSDLNSRYSGLTPDARKSCLAAFKLSESVSDTELLRKLDAAIDQLNQNSEAEKENHSLKVKLAAFKIDEAVRVGAIGEDERRVYLSLAIVDEETTMAIIYKRQSDKIELTELLKLSGRELYMQGKLERLKEISVHHFDEKYRELNQRN